MSVRAKIVSPRVVVFDLGKVLVDFDYSIAARKIAGNGRVCAREVQEFIDHSQLLFRYETGLIGRAEFFREVCAATGFCGTIEEFAGFFADIFVPIEPMVELQRRLRKQGVPTFILSNTNDLAVAHIRSNFPFFANFDGYVLSYEQGAMKPDAKIYEAAERVASAAGGQILFIDDREENVTAGTARGWHGIHHQSSQATIELVEKMFLQPAASGEAPAHT